MITYMTMGGGYVMAAIEKAVVDQERPPRWSTGSVAVALNADTIFALGV